ncbi:MAG: cupin domain-containing protein [Chloroflexi bacterium]|nr:MAG: cupin domain-containing protein [Chloroflexota bacterium]
MRPLNRIADVARRALRRAPGREDGPESRPALPAGLRLSTRDDAKVVRKHWGEERWLVHGDAPFVFKAIRLRAGQRTSLQYHLRKEEANLVVTGKARLHYDGGPAGPSMCPLGPGSVLHVRPGAVHRIEAITDVLLIEVSTPEVDDVVRLSDDWGRPDGRIDTEHRTG